MSRDDNSDEFSREANRKRAGIVVDVVDFVLHGKKWWLTPIVIVLLLLGALVMLGGTAAAPFIYTLF